VFPFSSGLPGEILSDGNHISLPRLATVPLSHSCASSWCRAVKRAESGSEPCFPPRESLCPAVLILKRTSAANPATATGVCLRTAALAPRSSPQGFAHLCRELGALESHQQARPAVGLMPALCSHRTRRCPSARWHGESLPCLCGAPSGAAQGSCRNWAPSQANAGAIGVSVGWEGFSE